MVSTSPLAVTEVIAGDAGAVSGAGQLTAAPEVVHAAADGDVLAAADGEALAEGEFAAFPGFEPPQAAIASASVETAIANLMKLIPVERAMDGQDYAPRAIRAATALRWPRHAFYRRGPDCARARRRGGGGNAG
jgi:hypothetical protein